MPVKINYHACKGCKACYNECPADLFGWDEERKIPSVVYPDECWHCGICKLECSEDAVKLTMPILTWLEINKRFVSKLSAPMELTWPEDDETEK